MGKFNTVFFCVTDFCNARCKTCSFWKTKQPVFPAKDALERTVTNIKDKLGCRFLQITGGEPLAYPFVYDLVEIATRHALSTQLMTNGSLLTEEKIRRLEQAGLKFMGISLDSFDEKVVEANRGIPNLLTTIKKNMEYLRKTKIITTAQVTVAKHNKDDLERIAEFALGLGFTEIGFCLPIKATSSTFKLGNDDSDAIDISDREMADILTTIMGIKRRFRGRINHKMAFLKDIRRYYLGKRQRFTCKGGENLFYLDNHLDLYQCMTRDRKLGDINGQPEVLKNSKCDACPLQCYREPSILYNGARSILPVLGMLLDPRKVMRGLGKR
jgi:MoaA/NifB/PqqE/SkfB family radical SAM enzyme